jgi:penicillin V acylase-like amidase (Ntn superfamily)
MLSRFPQNAFYMFSDKAGEGDMERRKFCKIAGLGLLGSVAALISPELATACTRVLWNAKSEAVIVGRTMDWPESTEPMLYVMPAGIRRDGGRLGPHVVIRDNPARWYSKYGSLVTTAYDLGSVDGVNEHGLAGHLLYLNATDYGPRDHSKPGLQAGLWLQFALDNAATVKDALSALDLIQIVMVEAHGHKASVHLAMEDSSGDSAIVEYIGGKRVIHHGRQYLVMTNDPSYDEQLVLLKKMEQRNEFTHPSRNTPLPGNMNPVARFQRASFFSRFLPEPHNQREAVAAMFSILANVSVPFGAPYKDFGTYNTEYRSVIDLTNKMYFFQMTTVPSVCWTRLSQLKLSPGSRVMALNPGDVGLAGDVTAKYQAAKAPF